MTTYEPMAGETIAHACAEALLLAIKTGSGVRFKFNDVPIVAKPVSTLAGLTGEYDEACERAREVYRNSPEGIEAAEFRRGQITARQALVNHLTNPAVVEGSIASGLDAVMSLIRELTGPADDVAVTFDKEALASALIAGGYAENEHVGQPKEWFVTRERFGRYVVGQVINCLKRGMPPHPITQKFCEQYDGLSNIALITDDEIERLKATKSEADWNTACDEIKRARGGQYPPDWWSRVRMSGLMVKIFATWGNEA